MSELKKAMDRFKPIEHKRVVAYLKALAEEKLAQHRRYLVTENMYEGLAGEIGSDALLEHNLLEFAISCVEELQEACTKPLDVEKPAIEKGDPYIHLGSWDGQKWASTSCGADPNSVWLTESLKQVDCPACQAPTHYISERRLGTPKGWEYRGGLTKSESKEELARLLEESKKHPDYDPRGTSTYPLPPSIWVNGNKEKK